MWNDDIERLEDRLAKGLEEGLKERLEEGLEEELGKTLRERREERFVINKDRLMLRINADAHWPSLVPYSSIDDQPTIPA